MSTIVLTGGGTAGHCTPNLALVPYLKKKFDKIYYIGSRDGIERRLARNAGLTYDFVKCAKLERKFTMKNLALPFALAAGIYEARVILKQLAPDIVFSKGGYISLPVVIAAKRLKIPVILHESDLTLGLANKIAAKFSTEVLTAFEKTAKSVKNGKFVGTPIREELFRKTDKRATLEKLGLNRGKKLLLVLGGSQGSEKINSLVKNNIDELTEKYSVALVCGKGKQSGIVKKDFYETEFSDDISGLMQACDLAVSRAGANTLFELIALGKPTLAIPLPKGNSRGDQIENAVYLKRKKLIEYLKEEDATDKAFVKKLGSLEENSQTLGKNCLALDLKHNAEKIAEEIFFCLKR